MRPLAVAACLLVALGPVAAGQKPWVGPQPPCSIEPGHFRVNSAILDLKLASEKPEQRDRMLHQAQDVLLRAIREDKQDRNAAAWYYLGRYYVEVDDAAGADTALARAEALAAACHADIRGYRAAMAEAVMNRGLTVWQGGNPDSAARLLRQAFRLDPTRPKPLFQLGSLYVERNELDTAAAVLREAAQAAGSDTAYRDAKREALFTVARLAFRRTQSDPAAQQWQHSRYSRDSIAPYVANDSAVLARMQQSSASRRARGARLSPADQQVFTRDSTARADALTRSRSVRDGLRQQASTDSVPAQSAYEPAIAAYRELVAAYPANPEAATTLSGILAQAGRPEEAGQAFEGLFNHAAELSTAELYELGQRLVQSRMPAPGAKAYTLALQQNPYHRDALAELASALVAGKDTAAALASAQRLIALDPLNKASQRVLGQAWDLRGRRDSAQKYVALADSRTLDVSIASLVADSGGAAVTGVASNLGSDATSPLRIVVEFLDAHGSVQSSQSVDIPAIPSGGSHQFQARASGKGIVGWRYRPS